MTAFLPTRTANPIVNRSFKSTIAQVEEMRFRKLNIQEVDNEFVNLIFFSGENFVLLFL